MTTSPAWRHLDDLEERASTARRRFEEMAGAVGRYYDSIPPIVMFGRPPLRTEMQTRMLHHLLRKQRHLDLLQGRLMDEHYLAWKAMSMEGICPVCDRISPANGPQGCDHMVERPETTEP